MVPRERQNVKVHLSWDENGDIIPLKVFWDKGFYYVDSVLSTGKGASVRAGGFGVQFRVKLTEAEADVSGVSYIYFERMPGQHLGVVLDEANSTLPVQLWYYYDESGERQNVKVEAEWSNTGEILPLVVWLDERPFKIKAGKPQWLSSRKEGGGGIRFVTEITNADVHVYRKTFVLYFDKCPQPEVWFVEGRAATE